MYFTTLDTPINNHSALELRTIINIIVNEALDSYNNLITKNLSTNSFTVKSLNMSCKQDLKTIPKLAMKPVPKTNLVIDLKTMLRLYSKSKLEIDSKPNLKTNSKLKMSLKPVLKPVLKTNLKSDSKTSSEQKPKTIRQKKYKIVLNDDIVNKQLFNQCRYDYNKARSEIYALFLNRFNEEVVDDIYTRFIPVLVEFLVIQRAKGFNITFNKLIGYGSFNYVFDVTIKERNKTHFKNAVCRIRKNYVINDVSKNVYMNQQILINEQIEHNYKNLPTFIDSSVLYNHSFVENDERFSISTNNISMNSTKNIATNIVNNVSTNIANNANNVSTNCKQKIDLKSKINDLKINSDLKSKIYTLSIWSIVPQYKQVTYYDIRFIHYYKYCVDCLNIFNILRSLNLITYDWKISNLGFNQATNSFVLLDYDVDSVTTKRKTYTYKHLIDFNTHLMIGRLNSLFDKPYMKSFNYLITDLFNIYYSMNMNTYGQCLYSNMLMTLFESRQPDVVNMNQAFLNIMNTYINLMF